MVLPVGPCWSVSARAPFGMHGRSWWPLAGSPLAPWRKCLAWGPGSVLWWRSQAGVGPGPREKEGLSWFPRRRRLSGPGGQVVPQAWPSSEISGPLAGGAGRSRQRESKSLGWGGFPALPTRGGCLALFLKGCSGANSGSPGLWARSVRREGPGCPAGHPDGGPPRQMDSGG